MSKQFFKYWLPLLLLNLAFCGLVIKLEYHYLHSENSVLENLQACLLLLSTVTYFWLSTHCTGQARLGWIAASLLCYSFITREVDIELLPLFEHVGFLFHGLGRTLMLLVLWSCYLRLFLAQGAHSGFIANLLRSQYFHYFVLSFLLLVTGAIFDREILNMQYGQLFEELLEANAYLLLLLPSLYELYRRYTDPSIFANKLDTKTN